MDNKNLRLETIYNLLGLNFFVPDYQRGYRWKRKQVKDLLDDIWKFKDTCQKGDFYCLQPIVVKQLTSEEKHKYELKEESIWYEVIDGQQRLTTIRIIISFLTKEHIRRPISEAYPDKEEFVIQFQTRKDSKGFLDNIEESNKNIDYFHISEAYNEVRKWFEKKNFNDNNKFLEIFLANEEAINSVQVIWYEINETGTNPIDVFTRINIGKIPLTNAELIKALFLQKNNFDSEKCNLKQLQIANEWDIIEKTLQDDSFWFFIYNTTNSIKYDNRIEYIFDLLSDKKEHNEYYYTFNHFALKFHPETKEENAVDIDKEWLKVKKYYQVLDDWYKDHEFYHLVGFLIDSGKGIDALMSMMEKNTKSKFRDDLKKEISKELKITETDFDLLEYSDNNIKKILLLFNIQTILNSEKSELRFPFNKYKDKSWDIEHVRSVTEKQIPENKRKDWLIDVLEYYTGLKQYSSQEDIQKQSVAIDHLKTDKPFLLKIIELLQVKQINNSDFQSVYTEITTYFKEQNTPENINSISNLALLDAETNRSYKNAMFPIKRKRIISNDKQGILVPICTKNLFLKYYSKKMGNVMYWNEDDATDYMQSMKQTLTVYFKN